MFLKRLFSRKERAATTQLLGVATPQTQIEQDATREHMESELTHAPESHVQGSHKS